MEEVFVPCAATASQFRHGKWSKEEDELLRRAVSMLGERNWREVAEQVPGRNSIQCLHRWTKILRPGLIKGSWSVAEDAKLQSWVQSSGPTKWSQCALLITGRSGKQCRERWLNALSPVVKKGDWSEQEDSILLQTFEKLGAKWSEIAKYLPGRTDNAIKNRFYSNVRKIRPRNVMCPVEGNNYYYDDGADPTQIETEMLVFNLLRHMKRLEAMLSSTRKYVVELEQSIDRDIRQMDV